VRLRPADGAPPLDAECALAEAPREGDAVGVTFTPGDVLVLPGTPDAA
jgi:thiamine transport system ATP-binding protein